MATETPLLVETQYYNIPENIQLDSGKEFGPITVAYETYGSLNSRKSNAILILHALSGDAHCAGYHSPEDNKPGWWDMMVGPGKPIDSNKYFIISSNVLGGCKGTTGPSSINPETGNPYGLSFPIITINDMVKVQKKLLEHLEIPQLLTVVGGSMGGMQALQWMVSYPDSVYSCIPIAATSRLSAQSIAFNEVSRQAIISDPNYNNGDYYDGPYPEKGLAVARMIGHITYLSDESMHQKFGRRLQFQEELSYNFLTEFQVESYLHHQGQSFVRRFDANSLLYLSKAMDYFDLAAGANSLEKTFSRSNGHYLVVSFTSDWLFPTYQSWEITSALQKLRFPVTFTEIDSQYGHDAFLLEKEQLGALLANFLESTHQQFEEELS